MCVRRTAHHIKYKRDPESDAYEPQHKKRSRNQRSVFLIKKKEKRRLSSRTIIGPPPLPSVWSVCVCVCERWSYAVKFVTFCFVQKLKFAKLQALRVCAPIQKLTRTRAIRLSSCWCAIIEFIISFCLSVCLFVFFFFSFVSLCVTIVCVANSNRGEYGEEKNATNTQRNQGVAPINTTTIKTSGRTAFKRITHPIQFRQLLDAIFVNSFGMQLMLHKS